MRANASCTDFMRTSTPWTGHLLHLYLWPPPI